jgi:Ser/Thr protein kinase RdoA (MazF antagonist)
VNPDTHHVSGLIDFGDSVYTWTIADVAIALAYSSLSYPENPLPAMCALLSAYCAESGPLSAFELEHLTVSFPVACLSF